ncbi:hypothetical protein BGV72_30470 [Burkholderia ubonensis]|uniref:hypothetical protein n=1 Tax=Burkholderia ubonensis TaxID=101571 RepID=UPI0008FDBB1A|nr:hypothetical protein [Burkholderia ubonensis]OJA71529.1 hypothetical protein BGV72_30470 [Burkholderia ubonensis]
MFTVYLKTYPALTFKPEDFAQPQFIRHACGVRAVHLYAELRARGEGKVGAFHAAFGNEIQGSTEDVLIAAEQFERSSTFQNAHEGAQDRIGRDELRKEWAARLDEISVTERDHAAFLNAHSEFLESKGNKKYEKRCEAFDQIISERTKEAEKRAELQHMSNETMRIFG